MNRLEHKLAEIATQQTSREQDQAKLVFEIQSLKAKGLPAPQQFAQSQPFHYMMTTDTDVEAKFS